MLEDSLHETHAEFEKLQTNLREASEQLANCAQEKAVLESHTEERKRKYDQVVSQKKSLQVSSFFFTEITYVLDYFLF